MLARLLTTRAEWLPLGVAVLALLAARRPQAGLALAALLGAGVAAAGLAGVLVGEKLLFVISIPQAHSEVAFIGRWRWLLPLLAGAACLLPVLLRWSGWRRLQPADTILAGAALLLLGAAWSHPLLP